MRTQFFVIGGVRCNLDEAVTLAKLLRTVVMTVATYIWWVLYYTSFSAGRLLVAKQVS